MNFFRQEIDAAVDALLMQQLILMPTAGGWALACDAELPRVAERLRKLASEAGGGTEQRLVAAELAGAAGAAEETPAEFTRKLTRRLGHPVLAVVVGATWADVPAGVQRAADYAVGWGR